MTSEWDGALEAQLAALFSGNADPEAVPAVLAPVLDGNEGARVAVACLKRAGAAGFRRDAAHQDHNRPRRRNRVGR